ncbi:MAG: peptidoglycan editing factor PgeF [Gammaproteobacteria bacterium]|nr:peptidoglycan editing factor PgeF [Gammaproteobacteria bacterium]
MSVADLHENPACVVPDWNVPSHVVALTTTRRTGTSTGPFKGFNIATHVDDEPQQVLRNREKLAEMVDSGVSLQWLDQVHGTEAKPAIKGAGLLRADACYTSEAGVACCVTTADCLPVLLTTRSGGMVAAAHCGWRGLAIGILEHTIAEFTSPARDIVAWMGPAIGPCHFEVGAEVRDAFILGTTRDLRARLDACFVPTQSRGKFMADLYQLARIKLGQLGVESISGGDFCTYCQADEFYSFRRQNKTGRMVSLIYLNT